MKNKFKNRLIIAISWFIIIIIIAITTIRALTIIDEKNKEKAIPSKLPKVDIIEVKNQNINKWVWGEGTAFTIKREFLRFEIAGRVVKIADDFDGNIIREGSRVKKGQMLAEIDSRDYIQLQKEYETDLLRAKNSIKTASLNISRLKNDHATKIKQVARMKKLANKKVISLQKLELMQSELNDAKFLIRSAEVAKKQAQLQLLLLETKIERNRIDLERTKIVAPFNGVIARLNIKIGDYASLGSIDMSSKYRSIMTTPIIITDPSSYEIKISMPAYLGKEIKIGMMVQIYSDILEHKNKKSTFILGSVYSITPDISLEKRTMKITIRTRNIPNKLINGESVLARIKIKSKQNCNIIPFSIIQFDNKEPYIFRYKKDSMVEKQFITLGIQQQNNIEVLKGVIAGESVVSRGQNSLIDGDKVDIISKGKNNE